MIVLSWQRDRPPGRVMRGRPSQLRPQLRRGSDELAAVEVAVLFPNGIKDWDFVAAYREGNLFLDKVRHEGKTDTFVILDDDLMSEIPPCPLITGPELGR